MSNNQQEQIEAIFSHPRRFEKLWSDEGTGCKPNDCSFWRPLPPPGFFFLGDVGEPAHTGYPSAVRSVFVRASESASHLLSPPVDYERIWSGETMKRKGACGPVSFWRPKPPANYVSMGDVMHKSYKTKPDLPLLRCVHVSLVESGDILRVLGTNNTETSGFIWCDHKSKCKDGDLSVWQISNRPTYDSVGCGTFLSLNRSGQDSYSLPVNTPPCYCIKRKAFKTVPGGWVPNDHGVDWVGVDLLDTE